MKMHLTSTEYFELRLLVDHILSATSKEVLDEQLKQLDAFRSRNNFLGSVGSVINELSALLKQVSYKKMDQERLSYFMFADNYLQSLKDYVRTD